jgi:hypothetical protein
LKLEATKASRITSHCQAANGPSTEGFPLSGFVPEAAEPRQSYATAH